MCLGNKYEAKLIHVYGFFSTNAKINLINLHKKCENSQTVKTSLKRNYGINKKLELLRLSTLSGVHVCYQTLLGHSTAVC